jgi:hypothetical protein
MTEAPSGPLGARVGGSGAAAADDSVAATGHEVAKTTADTEPRIPATTAGSGTVLLHNVAAHYVNVTGRACYLM